MRRYNETINYKARLGTVNSSTAGPADQSAGAHLAPTPEAWGRSDQEFRLSSSRQRQDQRRLSVAEARDRVGGWGSDGPARVISRRNYRSRDRCALPKGA